MDSIITLVSNIIYFILVKSHHNWYHSHSNANILKHLIEQVHQLSQKSRLKKWAWVHTKSETYNCLPMVPPKAIAPDIWANNSGLGFRPPRVADRPPATPIMPSALPRRAVPWVERPARAPTQHRPEPKYMIFSKEKGREREREKLSKLSILSAYGGPLLRKHDSLRTTVNSDNRGINFSINFPIH